MCLYELFQLMIEAVGENALDAWLHEIAKHTTGIGARAATFNSHGNCDIADGGSVVDMGWQKCPSNGTCSLQGAD